MKRAFAVLVLFLIVLLIFFWFVRREIPQKRQGTSPPTVLPTWVNPPPRTLDFPPIPPGARFIYEGPPKAFPQSLPLYKIGRLPSGQEAAAISFEIAGRLGFTASPSAFIKQDSFFGSWMSRNAQFSAAKNKASFSVSFQLSTIAGAVPLKSDPRAVTSFVRNAVGYPREVSLDLRETALGGGEGLFVLDSPPPVLRQWFFSASLANIPVLTPEYSPTWVHSVIDERGYVRAFSAILYPRSFVSGESVELVSVADAVTNLNAGRGLILKFGSPEEGEIIVVSFNQASLTEVSLVYIPAASQLRPAFLFVGNATDATNQQQIVEALVLASP